MVIISYNSNLLTFINYQKKIKKQNLNKDQKV